MNRLSITCVVTASAVLSVAVAGQPAGQSPELREGVFDKGRTPLSSALPHISLPRRQEADLSNGLHVTVVQDRRAPQARIQLVIRGAGGYFDPPDHIGLAQFTAANALEGTATRSSADIAEQLDRLAATLTTSAEMNAEDATFTAIVLTEHLDAVLDIMADVVTHATFPGEEWARYKAQAAARLTQQRANPDFLARERFAMLIAGDHPDARIAPTRPALDKTTRESLVAFHRERYVPDYGVVAIVGDVALPSVMSKLEARLSGWRAAGKPTPRVSDRVAPGARGFEPRRPGRFVVSLCSNFLRGSSPSRLAR